jgi:transcription elongation factor GreA
MIEREMEMQQTVLSERMFEILTDHVAEIEREKEFIIKDFYADNAAAGMESEIFFRDYTARIEEFLKNVRVKKDAPDSCPLSIIGSTVEVRDTEDMEVFSYQIVLPFKNKMPPNMSQASCFSPMGKALLLQQVGSKVAVMTPGGQVEYEIMSITLDETAAGGETPQLFQGNTSMVF